MNTRRAVVTVLGTLALTGPLLGTAPGVAGSVAAPVASSALATPGWSPRTRLAPSAQRQALAVDGRWSAPRRTGRAVGRGARGAQRPRRPLRRLGQLRPLRQVPARGRLLGERFTVSPDSGVEVLESADVVVAPDGDATVLWDQESLPLKVRVLSTP